MSVGEDELREQIKRHKDAIHRKVKLRNDVEEAKKEAAATYRVHLKELKEEIQEELDAIDELESNLLEVRATELLEDPATVAVASQPLAVA